MLLLRKMIGNNNRMVATEIRQPHNDFYSQSTTIGFPKNNQQRRCLRFVNRQAEFMSTIVFACLQTFEWFGFSYTFNRTKMCECVTNQKIHYDVCSVYNAWLWTCKWSRWKPFKLWEFSIHSSIMMLCYFSDFVDFVNLLDLEDFMNEIYYKYCDDKQVAKKLMQSSKMFQKIWNFNNNRNNSVSIVTHLGLLYHSNIFLVQIE